VTQAALGARRGSHGKGCSRAPVTVHGIYNRFGINSTRIFGRTVLVECFIVAVNLYI
jgi:hypothetical protein